MEEVSIIIKAGAAARAKNASEVADQTDVARVWNPSGPSIRVAGSSFIVRRNTSAAPISTPERIRGRVIRAITRRGLWPRERAASSNRGLICSSVERTEPSATGKNRTA